MNINFIAYSRNVESVRQKSDTRKEKRQLKAEKEKTQKQ